MIKRLLLCVAMFAFVGSLSAQKAVGFGSGFAKNSSSQVEKATDFKFRGMDLSAFKNKVAATAKQMPAAANSGAKKLAPMMRADANNTIWFGYPGDASGQGYILGWNQLSEIMQDASLAGRTEYNVAIMLPSIYARAVIDSLELDLYSGVYSNVKVWMAPIAADEQGYLIVPGTPEEAEYCETFGNVDMSTPADNILPMIMKLPRTYTVPETGCFIGVSFTTTVANPLFFWGQGQTGGFLMQWPYQGSMAWTDMVSLFGSNLAMFAHMDVTNCPSNNVSVSVTPEIPALINNAADFAPVITNNGASAISGVSYVLTVDGVAQPEQTVSFTTSLPAGSSGQLSAPYTFTTDGIHSCTIEITKVDGDVNTSTTPSNDFTVIALEKAAERTAVVEEFTGTWCGWCPRGHVGMKKLKERYGDKIITLAGHASNNSVDPMQCSSYMDVVYGFASGFPLAVYNRYGAGDPYYGLSSQNEFGAYQYVEIANASAPSEATVALSADWSDDSKSAINADVTVNFGYTRMNLSADNPYAVAFILSEDGMTGTSQEWMQLNYYSGNTSYGTDDLMSWVSQGEYVSTTYDNVVVQAWDALQGADESIPAIITKGADVEYKSKLDISANTLIQNKENLSLTALLINRHNFYIVNAAQVRLGGNADGISGVENDANGVAEVARYNASGVLLSAPQKGLNIVKYSDGTTKKVMVK